MLQKKFLRKSIFSLILLSVGVNLFGLTAPSNLAPNGTSSVTSPTLSWTKNNNTNIATYEIKMVNAGTGAIVLNYVNVGDVSSKAISGLQAGQSYRWVVRAVRSGSTSAESAAVTFSIPVTLVAPSNLSPNLTLAANATSATLSWTKNNAAGIATYEVRLVNVATGAVLLNYESVGDANSKTVSGLQAGQSYRWVVRAVRSGSTSAESAAVTFSIPVTLVAPSNLSPNSTLAANATSATLSWTKNNAAGIATYEVRLVNVATGAVLLNYESVGDANSKAISGLQAGQSYRWVVRAVRSGSTSAESAAVTFSIPVTLVAPSNLSPNSTLAANATSATLTWTKNNAAGIATYEVRLVNVATGAVLLNYESVGDANSKTISGLQAGQSYRWVVRAVRSGSTSAESAAVTFSIPVTLVAPSNLSPNSTLAATATSATLSWTKNNAAGIATYEVRLVNVATGAVLLNYESVGDANSKAISGLQAGQSYRWVVRAVRSGSTSAESAAVTFSVPAAVTAPSNLAPNSSIAINATSATLTWTKNNATALAAYEVRLVNTTTGTVILDYVNVGDVNTKTVSNLQIGHSYRWVVRAVRSGAANAESAIAVFHLSSPPAFTVTQKGNNALIDISPVIVNPGTLVLNKIERSYNDGAFKALNMNDYYNGFFDTGLNMGTYTYKLTQTINGIENSGNIKINISQTIKGVTVLIHGFTPVSGSVPGWMTKMATAIGERSGKYTDGNMKATVLEHDPKTGKWIYKEGSHDPNEEIVLLYNWADESDKAADGWTEAAGDNLFASLMDFGRMTDNAVKSANILARPWHFICHSRGNIVALHAFMRFAGIKDIAHYTALDPHPAEPMDDQLAPFVKKSTDKTMVYELLLPKNVLQADNYFRRDGLYEDDGDFNGIRFAGNDANNFELCEDVLSKGYTSEHSDTHLWYYGTIKTVPSANNGDENVPQSWYNFNMCSPTNYNRYEVGYNKSRLGNGLIKAPQVTDKVTLTKSGFFNGNFGYGKSNGLGVPGWEKQGGSMEWFSAESQKLSFGMITGAKVATSNFIYIPDVSSLSFDLNVNTNATDKKLYVKMDDDIIGSITLKTGVSKPVISLTAPAPLRVPYKGTTRRVTFEINSNDLNFIANVDNIQFINTLNKQPSNDNRVVETNVLVYPNPVNGDEIHFTQPTSFTIADMTGKIMANQPEKVEIWSIDHLPNGIFLIRTDTNQSIKLVVNR
ncbi:MAG: hypothetical protein RLZZ628_2168 [Bacteroidota bacterium]